MAFHLGSLGFLTPFKFETYQSQVTQVIEGTPPRPEARRASRVALTRGFLAGNAAIVLRSRLKVRVLKENREKKARVDKLGVILTNGDVEGGRKVAQYQVRAEEPRVGGCEIRRPPFYCVSPNEATRAVIQLLLFRAPGPRAPVPGCAHAHSFRRYILLQPQVSLLPLGSSSCPRSTSA